MKSQLDEFLKGAGQRPYRQLVEHHLRRKSVPDLQQAVIGETDLLPQQVRPFVMGYIDVTNRQLAYDQEFWSRVTCREAFEAIIEIAIESMPIGDKVASVNEALEPSNHELAFGLFQICTLSFCLFGVDPTETATIYGDPERNLWMISSPSGA